MLVAVVIAFRLVYNILAFTLNRLFSKAALCIAFTLSGQVSTGDTFFWQSVSLFARDALLESDVC